MLQYKDFCGYEGMSVKDKSAKPIGPKVLSRLEKTQNSEHSVDNYGDTGDNGQALRLEGRPCRIQISSILAVYPTLLQRHSSSLHDDKIRFLSNTRERYT